MEPRPEGRGDEREFFAKVIQTLGLQWSHAPKGVETSCLALFVPFDRRLQWSHAPKGVETGRMGQCLAYEPY